MIAHHRIQLRKKHTERITRQIKQTKNELDTDCALPSRDSMKISARRPTLVLYVVRYGKPVSRHSFMPLDNVQNIIINDNSKKGIDRKNKTFITHKYVHLNETVVHRMPIIEQ